MLSVIKNITKVKSIRPVDSVFPEPMSNPYIKSTRFDSKGFSFVPKQNFTTNNKQNDNRSLLPNVKQWQKVTQKYQQEFSAFFKLELKQEKQEKQEKLHQITPKRKVPPTPGLFKKQSKKTWGVKKTDKKNQGMTPNEAANKILDLSLAQTRKYLGSCAKFVEYPIKIYVRARLEQIFTFLAENGRVNEYIVNNFSYYALQLFCLLSLIYLWEKERDQKDKINNLENEIEELQERYGEDVLAHQGIREKIIKKSEKLLNYQQEAKKYETILAKVKEAQTISQKEQSSLTYIKENVSAWMTTPDERQDKQVINYLTQQNDEAAQLTLRALDKAGRVRSLVIKSEDKLEDLDKKINKAEKEVANLITSATRYAEHIKCIGTKHDEKLTKLKNTIGFSFFSQYKETIDNQHLSHEEPFSSIRIRTDN
ncbi:Uncharacterised protein [Legionella busanensis]|uniref:Uncharacterized protein n=1 Tax=Legionella busanensis TaxID=190655 RepID=A0A378JN66_9GAMM|nr:hypothetical protein [Legionella busanensis]STX51450.1 Uncharacterised protein [Legionella busanensis]